MIAGLHHASITTADRDRLVAFYRDIMGFELVLESAWNGGNPVADAIFGLKGSAVKMAMLRTANAYLEIFEFDNPVGRAGDPDRPVCDAGITHICLSVSDIDGEYARLTAAGMRFHCPPQPASGIGRATYGRDPDGNIIELLEPNPAGPFAFPPS
jgi:catechol 2,3-dioxygenase-like lactoylglutathione lyase family enzyme